MVVPSRAHWVRVELPGRSLEFLIGPDLVDVEQLADTLVVLTLGDGRSWQVRVVTADALVAEVAGWRHYAEDDDLMSYTDLIVVRWPGIESMTRAVARATEHVAGS